MASHNNDEADGSSGSTEFGFGDMGGFGDFGGNSGF